MVVHQVKGRVGDLLQQHAPDALVDPVRRMARHRRLRRAIAEQRARGLAVDARIHPDDTMLVPRDPGHYVWVGASGLAAIERSLSEAGSAIGAVERILDLPCGHGRVLRFLRARWPDARITACDIDRSGVEFCAATFGAEPIVSANPISTVEAPDDHDLVWVGSLLTHLDAHRWPEVLTWLRDHTREGGVLVVSTHGAEGARRMSAGDAYGLAPDDAAALRSSYEATGFGYAPYPWDPEYGISLSSPDWVRGVVDDLAGLEVVSVRETAWADHHDVVTLQRAAAS